MLAVKEADDLECAYWWQRWFRQWTDSEPGRCTKRSQNHMSNFTRDKNSPLFGIPYR